MKKLLMLLAVTAGFTAVGETWYYTGAGYKDDAITNTVYWTSQDKTVACPAITGEDDFVVSNWKWMWSPAGQNQEDYHFSGKSLAIGQIGGQDGKLEIRFYNNNYSIYFDNEGLFLDNGLFTGYGYRMRTLNVRGDITVRAPESAPFHIHGGGKLTSNEGKTLLLHGPFKSAKGTMAVAGVVPAGFENVLNEITNFTLRIDGPCDNYLGKLKISGMRPRIGNTYDTAVKLACPEFGGSIIVANNGILNAAYDTNVIKIASLSFEPGSTLEVLASNTTNAIFEVENSFAAEGPVTVLMNSQRIKVCNEGDRFTVLSLPKTAEVSVDDFRLELTGAKLKFTSEAVYFAVREDGERKYLDVVVEPIVKLTVADYNSFNWNAEKSSSAFKKASSWSDTSSTPHSGCHYFNEKIGTIITPDTDSYSFLGRSLSIYDERTNSPFIVFTKKLNLTKLHMTNGRLASGSYRSPVVTAESFAFYGIHNSIIVQMNQTLELVGPWKGDGQVDVIGNHAYGSNGRLRLTGDNSNFTGKIKLTVGAAAPNPDDNFQTLLIDDEKALGGAMDEMMFDALELNAYGTLEVTNSFRIAAERNRGIYVNGDGAISVPQGEKLAVDTLVTLEGSLVKMGEGTLSLGGTLDARSASELVVTNGVVEVAAADAINGASVKFSKDSALAIALGSSDVNLRNYGIRNLSDAPFAADTAQVPLYVDIPSVGDGVKNIECALFTVKTEHYAAADAMFVPKRTGAVRRGWVMKFSSRENGDGTTTKLGLLERAGFSIVIK